MAFLTMNEANAVKTNKFTAENYNRTKTHRLIHRNFFII